jgi:hypothetical protein
MRAQLKINATASSEKNKFNVLAGYVGKRIIEVLQKSLLSHFAPHEMRVSRQCF